MSKDSTVLDASAECSKVGPDNFSYFKSEALRLLSQDESVLPFDSEDRGTSNVVGTLFDNGAAANLSDFRKERLNILLKQALGTFTPEVEGMLDPVLSMCRLRALLKSRQAGSDDGASQAPQKKLKTSTRKNSESYGEGSGSKCNDSKFSDVALAQNGLSNSVERNCNHCHTTKSTQWSTGPAGKSLCNSCSTGSKRKREDKPESTIGVDKENEEEEDDLLVLLAGDPTLVNETMKKYSDELHASLVHMEKQLEELINAVVSKSRLMIPAEKHQLRNLIRELPPQNLDRVAQIVNQGKPDEAQPRDEIFVDLIKEDNAKLWRLYYYVEAVKKARKDASA